MSKKDKTLLIDCGNSFIKWSLCDEQSLTDQESALHKDASVLEVYKGLIDSHSHTCKAVIMVSVLGEVFTAGAKIIAEDAGLSFTLIQSQAEIGGIVNAYDNPSQIGSDRLVAMVAAYDLVNNNEACIVIDSGTATTIDAVDENGNHMGGVIFPGLQLSIESLSGNTELLPLLNTDDLTFDEHGFAKDTSQAIASGCMLSLAGAIDGICNKMQRQLIAGNSKTSIEVKRVICGGAAKSLMPYLENSYKLHDDLIMQGLKRIKNDL